MRIGVFSAIALMISSCATLHEPVPRGHDGELATFIDSYSNLDSTSAHYFELLKVDGKEIASSYGETRKLHYGDGMEFTPSMLSRYVMATEQTFTIRGIVFFPTNAQMLVLDDMEVRRDIRFTPRAGEAYTVKGELDKDSSDVWLEDSKGQIVR